MTYIFAAKLFGLVSTILALGILFNMNHAKKMAGELLESASGYILAGVLPTIFGSWIVAEPDHLQGWWPLLVTIIGLLMLFSGLFRLWFPHAWQKIVGTHIERAVVLFSLFGLMLGLLLLYIGFLSHHL